jgi:hypothetical protein
MSDRQSAEHWVEGLFAAWREADPERASSLFTTDAEYRAHPFRDPLLGREQIHDYWAAALIAQDDVDLHVGEPVVDGSRAAVEWWVSLREGGIDSVSSGTLFLLFDESGRCRSLREVWMEQPGRQAPYPGWGT